MTRIMLLAIGMAALLASAPADATPKHDAKVDRDVTALMTQAEAQANTGDYKAATASADRALALAEAAKRDDLRFIAIRRSVIFGAAVDPSTAPDGFDRLAEAAERAFGHDSFQAVFSRFKSVQWRYNAHRPGVTLADLAAATEAVSRFTDGDEQRTLGALALATLANQVSATDVPAALALSARSKALADSMPTLKAAELGQTYGFLASVALKADDATGAIALCDQAIAIYESDQGKRSSNLISTLSTQAVAARRLGQFERAEAMLRRAVGIADSSPEMPHQFRARIFLDYTRFLTARGRFELAVPMAERAVAEAATLPPTQALPQSIVFTAGQTYRAAGRPAEALRHLRRALTLAQATEKPDVNQAVTLLEIGRAELEIGNAGAAQTAAVQAQTIADATTPPGSATRGAARLLLADLAAARGDAAAAAGLYRATAAEVAPTATEMLTVATANVRVAAMETRLAALDSDEWRAARTGGDLLTRDVVRAAAANGEGLGSRRSGNLFDDLVDVAWSRAAALR